MNFCLNRDTKLYYLSSPIVDKNNLPKEGEGEPYIKCLNPDEFVAINPRFSEDHSKLLYFGSKDRFISHSGNMQLRYLKWPPTGEEGSTLVIDKHPSYPTDDQDFAGIYGYNQTFCSMQFLGTQSRYAVFESPIRAQNRIYIVDIETKQVKWLDFLGKGKAGRHGDYEL
jgi:hypothetical protein